MDKKTKIFTSEIVKANINTDEMTIVHYISTNVKDRYGEVMLPDGMDKTNYEKNPIVLFAHDSYKLPIAKSLWLKKDDKGTGILAKTQFDRKSEISTEIFRLYNEGFLNAWSVGFMYKEAPELIGDTYYVKSWELLEYSSVPVPANPEALSLGMKGINNEIVKEALTNTKEFHNLVVENLLKQNEIFENVNKQIDLINEKTDKIEKNLIDLEKRTAKKLYEILNK